MLVTKTKQVIMSLCSTC